MIILRAWTHTTHHQLNKMIYFSYKTGQDLWPVTARFIVVCWNTVIQIRCEQDSPGRDVKSSRPRWPQGQNFRPLPRNIRPRPSPGSHSHEGCPRGLIVSYQNHVICITLFSDRKLLLALWYCIEVNFWTVHWHCCDCHTGRDFLVLINFMLEHKLLYTAF